MSAPLGPAPREELAAVRWLDAVIATRDAGVAKYAPPVHAAAVVAEQNDAFLLQVPLGTLRYLHTHIQRLRAREVDA